jgi:hypothetical protein
VQAQVTAYEDHTGAQLYVVEPGTRTLFADSSRVPIARVAQVRATPGVAWAAPGRALYMILELHNKKVAVAVVGCVPGLAGGPSKLSSGRLPRAGDEVVVDRSLARTKGLRLGRVGNTGNASGGPTHLHIEVHLSDPAASMPAPGGGTVPSSDGSVVNPYPLLCLLAGAPVPVIPPPDPIPLPS